MLSGKKIQVGIGFATGRKNFLKVLQTNIYSWQESGLVEEARARLNLFVAYDLKYNHTQPSDYTNIGRRLSAMVDDVYFLDTAYTQHAIAELVSAQVVDAKEAKLLFGRGYAGQRNIVLYAALKNRMDYLLFLDDDEYPMAVTKTGKTAIWSGQHVLTTHLQHIQDADITNGHHCGYISPIPFLAFDDVLTENDFKVFIGTISNDIVNWDKLRALMLQGGVTYADTQVLVSNQATDVPEVAKCKFISGANLCINLTNPDRVYPFYNPPGARGEDTFLSTCLSERTVKRVPCYTFHDGFGAYNCLLNGVLPLNLKPITTGEPENVDRFYKACIGWIRYKPLLLYITQRDTYEETVAKMKDQLAATLPKLCTYFGRENFLQIATELESYHKNVRKHYAQFLLTQQIWCKVLNHITQLRESGDSK